MARAMRGGDEGQSEASAMSGGGDVGQSEARNGCFGSEDEEGDDSATPGRRGRGKMIRANSAASSVFSGNPDLCLSRSLSLSLLIFVSRSLSLSLSLSLSFPPPPRSSSVIRVNRGNYSRADFCYVVKRLPRAVDRLLC